MSRTTQQTGRRGLTAAAGLLALTGATTLFVGCAGPDGPPQPAGTAVVAAAPPTAAAPSAAAPAPAAPPAETAAAPAPAAPAAPGPDFGPILPASAPVSVAIPAIGLEPTALVPLEIDDAGVLAAPVDYAAPGWHVAGPIPGTLGPAVIAGHVDGPDGPAVFYHLGALQPGDLVDVAREDGTIATFAVDSVERFAKDAFPTARVYGNTTSRSEIRLITCGGAFDRTTGHYVDNIVVFGHLVTPAA